MTRDEIAERINAALVREFNSDGDRIGFSIGAPPDGLNDGSPVSVHNFSVQVSVPLKE